MSAKQTAAGRINPMQFATKAAESDQVTPCPKCKTGMILAAITPHPIAAQMRRHTFLCVQCNQTKTYVLPAE